MCIVCLCQGQAHPLGCCPGRQLVPAALLDAQRHHSCPSQGALRRPTVDRQPAPEPPPLSLHLDMPCRGGVAQQQVLAVVVHRQLRGCEDGGPNSCRPHAAVQGRQPALVPANMDTGGWRAEAGGAVLLCRLCRLCRLVTALQMARCHVAPVMWQLLQQHALNGNTNKQTAGSCSCSA